MNRYKNIDIESFWDDSDYSLKNYVEESPSDEMVSHVERKLGYKLPSEYIEFMKLHNGGMVKKSYFVASSEKENIVIIEGIFSIGETKKHSLLGEFGSQFWIEEWEYPEIGVYICDTISGGHDMIALDYSNCGKEGEPEVVWIAQESDYEKKFVAKDFSSFIHGLVEMDLVDEFEDMTLDVESKLFEICLETFKNRKVEEEIYCVNLAYSAEKIIPPLFAFGITSDKEKWHKNPELYLWNIAEYTLFDECFEVDEETQKLFDRYNFLASKLHLWNVQIKTILKVTKRLKQHISEFDWNISEDFVMIATDLEQVDVERNFEFLS